MNLSQSIMNVQHRATPEQWQAIKANGHLPTRSTILELLCRIKALEAAQHAHVDASRLIDPEREKAAQKVMQSAGFAPLPLSSEAELRAFRLHSYKVGKAEPVENWGEGHTLVEPPVYATEAKPNHPETPGGSLVDRVACAIYPDGSGDGFREEAREAIREVAAWLLKNHIGQTGTTDLVDALLDLLEREAER